MQNTPSTASDDKLLTQKQSQKIYPASDSTYRRNELSGVLVPVRVRNRKYFRESDLRKLVANGAPA